MFEKFFRKSKGYSLVEVLISIVLVGVGLVSVIGVFPMGLSYIRLMGQRVFVVQQAQAQIEFFKYQTYDDLYSNYVDKDLTFQLDPLVDLTPFLVDPNLIYTDPNADPLEYGQYRSIAEFTRGIPDENVIHIKIEIYWNESTAFGKLTGNERSYVLEAYKGVGVQ